MSDLTSALLLIVVVAAAIAGLQMLQSNKGGAEADIRAILATIPSRAWHFVALEYCYGILNRTYLVLVTDRMMCGAKVRGILAAPIHVTERWRDPYFYARPTLVAKCVAVDPESQDFLALSGANFQLDRASIELVEFSDAPKWGMGAVPYSGRLFLHLRSGRTRELILLGVQNGMQLRDRLRAAGFGRVAA